MTVSTVVNHEQYVGNGTTTVFPYRFRILSSSHMVVTVSDTDGAIRTLSLDTDYKITGIGLVSGGNVVLSSALPENWLISLERDLPAVQETDLRNQGRFFAETHEDAFDYLTMLVQKSLSLFSLALRKPSFISRYFDAQGNRISNLADPADDQDAVNNRSLRSYVDAAIAGATGGFGWFIQYGAGAIYRTFQDKMRDAVSVKDFGAKGDGFTDDTLSIQQAINSHPSVKLPAGIYRVTAELLISNKICHLFGAGVGVSIIYTDSPTANGVVFDLNYQQGGGLQDLTIASKSLTSDTQHVGSSGIGLYVKNANDNFFCDHFEVIRFGVSVQCRGCYQPRFTNWRFNWFSSAGIRIEKYDGTPKSAGNGCLFSIGKISNLGYLDGETTPPGIDVQFASGEFFRDIDIQKTGLSIRIKPPTNSYVRYVWFDNVLSDTANADGVLIDGGDAEVSNIFFNGCWSSNHVNNGVTLKGNNLSGVQWNGGTIRGSKNNGINFIAGKFISFNNVWINNNSNGNPSVYPGAYLAGSTSQISFNNCVIGNMPDSIANQHQGSGIVIDNGTSEAIKITNCDLRAYGSGSKPIDMRGTVVNSIIQNNLPIRTPSTNISNFTTINFNSYNNIQAGQNTYLTAGGVGSLAQARATAPSGIIIGIVITSSDTPGVNQNYAYNLLINDIATSLGSISNGSFKLNSNINAVVSSGDNIALQVLTSAGAAAATHRAAIMIGA